MIIFFFLKLIIKNVSEDLDFRCRFRTSSALDYFHMNIRYFGCYLISVKRFQLQNSNCTCKNINIILILVLTLKLLVFHVSKINKSIKKKKICLHKLFFKSLKYIRFSVLLSSKTLFGFVYNLNTDCCLVLFIK